MANSPILQQKYKAHFDLPKNSALRLHKAQYRNRHYGSTLTHAPPKKQNWAYTALENKQTAKHVQKYLRISFFPFWWVCSYAENLGVQSTPKLYE